MFQNLLVSCLVWPILTFKKEQEHWKVRFSNFLQVFIMLNQVWMTGKSGLRKNCWLCSSSVRDITVSMTEWLVNSSRHQLCTDTESSDEQVGNAVISIVNWYFFQPDPACLHFIVVLLAGVSWAIWEECNNSHNWNSNPPVWRGKKSWIRGLLIVFPPNLCGSLEKYFVSL